MARLLSVARSSLSLKTLAVSSLPFFSSSRSFISEMRRSAFKENLLRILRTEITYESEYRPLLTVNSESLNFSILGDANSCSDAFPQPTTSFDSFVVEDRPREQWIRMRRKYGKEEEIKVDATMFDGAVPPTQPAAAGGEEEPRLHISLTVEVSKGKASDFVLQFVCSAWPDSLEVEKVFSLPRGSAVVRPFMGPDFKELDAELQDVLWSYLEERGVNDDLAEFLHEYMANKDKAEFIRWMKNVESYVKE